MIKGFIMGIFIGIVITFVICKITYSRARDYSKLIEKTLKDLHSTEETSKKKH